MPTPAVHRTLAALASAVMLCATSPAAQEYALDVSVATSAKAAAFQVSSAGGSIPLTLLNTGKARNGVITISVTPFLSEAGERLEPQLSAGSQRGTTVTLKMPSELVSCELVVAALPGAGPFTGSLIIRTPGAIPTRQVVSIAPTTSSRPAVLQLMPDRDIKAFVIGNPLWRSREGAPMVLDFSLGPTFEIWLGDGGKKWTVKGVTTGPMAVIKSPDGFAAAGHLAIYDGHKELVTKPRDIPASGETWTVQLLNLDAGEYSATLPFHAENAATEPTRFTFTANIKHHWSWAMSCVFVALLLSFGASKLVEVRNERLRLTTRIEQLFPHWLDDEEETAAIVWIISIRSQASAYSRRWFLPSLDTVHARLDQIEVLLNLISSLRRARTEIDRSQVLPSMAKTRALTVARRIAEALDPDTDQAALSEQATSISSLRDWTRSDVAKVYAQDLRGSIQQLLADVDLTAIPAIGRPLAEDLVRELNTDIGTDLGGIHAREHQYARLKILWERRRADEFAELLVAATGSIDELFEAADKAAWHRLARSKRRRITRSGAARIDAHDPITFSFSTGDPDLDDTYFVKHALRYEWHFDLKGNGPFATSPTTMSPRVPQFALFPGTLEPSVTVFFKNEHETVAGDPVAISRNRAFTPVKGFSVGELVQLALAFVAAVTTGLQTFYFKAGGFGSLPDYLTLFAWGATIDQFKNFLQKLPTAAQSIQGTAAAAIATQNTTASTTTQSAATQTTSQTPAGSATASATPAPKGPAAPIPSPAPAKPAPPEIPDPPRRSALPLEDNE